MRSIQSQPTRPSLAVGQVINLNAYGFDLGNSLGEGFPLIIERGTYENLYQFKMKCSHLLTYKQ